MLSRHYLRVKTLQAIYSFFISGETDLSKGRRELFDAIEGISELMLYQVSALLEFRDFAENKLEENKKKHVPSANDLNPIRKFIENPVLNILRNNDELQMRISNYKINWADFQDHFRKLYFNVVEWKDYIDYMSSKSNTFEDHKAFVAKLFKKHIAFDGNLRAHYEELNIHWSEDVIISGLNLTQWLKNIDENNTKTHELEEIFNPNVKIGNDDDREFVKILFDKCVMNSDEYDDLIQNKIANWEIDRVNQVDMIILKMGLTEILEFPLIPIKASMNEYIELAKEYGTPKSNAFVNGVLDKLVEDLQSAGRINKSGRGLKSS
ncbi:MAG: transcription antitermination factor NusB [Bacteroidales bacterium]|jgi:N utilization substance protein B|nr:transcription antitermination factor NusB [Bacteroidales bacterium]